MSIVNVNWHETRKCPPGSLAIGAGLGVCEVLAANGFLREIGWAVSATEHQNTVNRWVDVREIRQLDGSEFFAEGS